MKRVGFAPSDVPRTRSLTVASIGALSDEELAAALGAPVEVVPALRGARNLEEAREYARMVLQPPGTAHVDAPETLVRFCELYANGSGDPKEVLRELKAVGGDLRALRLALTGRERGPALAAVLASIPREEALRRVVAAL